MSCGSDIFDAGGDSSFCPDCSSRLSDLTSANFCDRCARPLGPAAACPYCEGKGIFPFQSIAALGIYRNPLRRLIHQIKYHSRWPLAEILAQRLTQQKRVQNLLKQTDVLIPIPLHWSRHIGRGYNQARAVAARLSHLSRIPLSPAIIRLKNTPMQTAIRSGADRIANVRNAFALIRPRAIRSQRVTLIDDVMTSASTLKSAASSLRDAEPATIHAIVLAVADPRRRDFQTV